eukprot:SAG25_NODE_373_length_8948_cov_6.275059_16_plen_169_part_00
MKSRMAARRPASLQGTTRWAPAAQRIAREEGGEAALQLPLRPQRLRRVFWDQVVAARPGCRGEVSSDTRGGAGLASRRPPIGGSRHAAIRQPCSAWAPPKPGHFIWRVACMGGQPGVSSVCVASYVVGACVIPAAALSSATLRMVTHVRRPTAMLDKVVPRWERGLVE